MSDTTSFPPTGLSERSSPHSCRIAHLHYCLPMFNAHCRVKQLFDGCRLHLLPIMNFTDRHSGIHIAGNTTLIPIITSAARPGDLCRQVSRSSVPMVQCASEFSSSPPFIELLKDYRDQVTHYVYI
jgi:hypothetical protein